MISSGQNYARSQQHSDARRFPIFSYTQAQNLGPKSTTMARAVPHRLGRTLTDIDTYDVESYRHTIFQRRWQPSQDRCILSMQLTSLETKTSNATPHEHHSGYSRRSLLAENGTTPELEDGCGQPTLSVRRSWLRKNCRLQYSGTSFISPAGTKLAYCITFLPPAGSTQFVAHSLNVIKNYSEPVPRHIY